MAEDDYQDRTEQPTPKRRAEAREKGRVARSRDLSAALVLLTGVGVLAAWGATLGLQSAAWVQGWLGDIRPGQVSPGTLTVMIVKSAMIFGQVLAPIWLCLIVAAVLANYLQGGWVFSPARLAPDLGRLQFFSGLKRLCSGNSLMELLKSLAKVGLIAVVMYFSMKNLLPGLLPLMRQEPGQFMGYLRANSLEVAGKAIVLLLVLGILDYVYQRYRFEKNLRMTKQEVKDEMRQVEGDPRVKARLRSLMRQLATRRMMAEVPKADVVVTNPTRVAVALRYDSAAMAAPQVVAKGQGFVAQKIIALAQEAGVPRVENRELARSLYRLVEVGDFIPTTLYRAVAEVLAYIYSLKAQGGLR
uniref:Flagellar biosynthetic protein FlhB n=1 Tax=Desulfobacca acetoxidans TaxID=60893 RepID=A0A7V4LCP0_9BACT